MCPFPSVKVRPRILALGLKVLRVLMCNVCPISAAGGLPNQIKASQTHKPIPVVKFSRNEANPEKCNGSVSALLPFLLRAKSLTINICNRVSPFSELSINLPSERLFHVSQLVAPPRTALSAPEAFVYRQRGRTIALSILWACAAEEREAGWADASPDAH